VTDDVRNDMAHGGSEKVGAYPRLPVWELPAEQQGHAAAAHLSAALAGGWRPPAVATPIALLPGEVAHASTAFRASSFTGALVPYSKGYMVGFGNPAVLAATLGGSLLYNHYKKTQAERMAAPQWRPVDDGMLHLTSQRFGLQGRLGWADIPYPDVRASHCTPHGIVLFLDGQAPLLVSTQWPEYFFVLFQWLAYEQVVPTAAVRDQGTAVAALPATSTGAQ
jgi:hypothetical protein